MNWRFRLIDWLIDWTSSLPTVLRSDFDSQWRLSVAVPVTWSRTRQNPPSNLALTKWTQFDDVDFWRSRARRTELEKEIDLLFAFLTGWCCITVWNLVHVKRKGWSQWFGDQSNDDKWLVVANQALVQAIKLDVTTDQFSMPHTLSPIGPISPN